MLLVPLSDSDVTFCLCWFIHTTYVYLSAYNVPRTTRESYEHILHSKGKDSEKVNEQALIFLYSVIP